LFVKGIYRANDVRDGNKDTGAGTFLYSRPVASALKVDLTGVWLAGSVTRFVGVSASAENGI
jgi:hypothetical protein